MKKTISILTLCLAMLGSNVYAENFKVKINNKQREVKPVIVEVDKKELALPFSAYVVDGRTFVPIRELTESLGAEVIWDAKTNAATVSLGENSVKMQIDSKVVFINDEKKVIEENSIPKLTEYVSKKESKTMVPLRFLSETLGYKVEWYQEEYKAGVLTKDSIYPETENKKENDAEKEKKQPEKEKNKKEKAIAVSFDNRREELLEKEDGNYNKVVSVEFTEQVDNKNNNFNYEKYADDVKKGKIEKEISKTIKAKEGKVTLVIDAGHGGNDGGAPGVDSEKTNEKEIVLPIALKLAEKFEDDDKVEIILTRDDDTFVELFERPEIANRAEAELFLSIHANSADQNRNANGIEVYYAPAIPNPLKNVEQSPFAECLQKNLISETGAADRGIKAGGRLVVLRKTKNVAALAEVGFMSNPNELSNMKSEEYKDKIVEGLYQGILEYIDKYVEF